MGDCDPGPASFKTCLVITVKKFFWCSVQYKFPFSFLFLIGFFNITILKKKSLFCRGDLKKGTLWGTVLFRI